MLRGLSPVLLGSASFVILSVLATGAQAGMLPGRGHFSDGQGAITRHGGRMTINQSSATAIIDWKNFSVGKANNIVFDNHHGATLNIVHGADVSRIAGTLRSTGSVYLINRAGVVVSGNGRVDTQGSFIASGRGADRDAFGDESRRLHLAGAGRGNVVNRGVIDAGKTAGLFGRNVVQAGRVAARNASMIAANRVHVGGRVIAAGNVETSGTHVRLAGASIAASNWLVDPINLTVTASSAKTIDKSLGKGTNVTLQTAKKSAKGPGTKKKGAGDIIIAAAISWKTTAKLTLTSYHAIAINKGISLKGKGGLVLTTADVSIPDGDIDNLTFGAKGSVTFGNLKGKLSVNGTSYKLVNSIASLASAIAAKTSGNFALAKNVSAKGKTYKSAPIPTAYSGTFEGLGHTISNLTIHDTTDTVAGLFANTASTGVLRDIVLTNVNISDTQVNAITGALVSTSGGLVSGAHATGKVKGSTTTGTTGGLVGYNAGGTVENSSANVTVTGGDGDIHSTFVGGLIGYDGQNGTVTNTYATGKVTGGVGADVGGLIGESYLDNVRYSYATGNVIGGTGAYSGGLIGNDSGGNLGPDHATGNVTGGYNAGGLIGYGSSYGGNLYATGNVTADDGGRAGGLQGTMSGGFVIQSYATGDVTVSGGEAGGLVGYNAGAVRDTYATGAVSGTNSAYVGGLIGLNYTFAPVLYSYATGAVTDDGTGSVGGVTGYDTNSDFTGVYTDVYWDTTTSGITDATKGVGNAASVPGITAMTTAQLQAGLPDGFEDDTDVWKEKSTVNGGLPYLIHTLPH